jgi:hypothetical protein
MKSAKNGMGPLSKSDPSNSAGQAFLALASSAVF